MLLNPTLLLLPSSVDGVALAVLKSVLKIKKNRFWALDLQCACLVFTAVIRFSFCTAEKMISYRSVEITGRKMRGLRE